MSSERHVQIRPEGALAASAQRHLWMHFTRLTSAAADWHVPIIDRGEGCYVFDEHGRRYLDGLSGLFTVQVGHGREELAQAAAEQSKRLAYFPVWSFAHEPAIVLAERLAAGAPGDLDRVFFTPSGGDAVETAIKLARQYFKLRGEPMRTKVISRTLAYHGTSMGALSVTGVAAIKAPFEPLLPGFVKVQTPYRLTPSLSFRASTFRTTVSTSAVDHNTNDGQTWPPAAHRFV